MRSARFVLLMAGLLVSASLVYAHHALAAEYDLNRSVTVTGTVTKLEWGNPHVRLYLDTRGSGNADLMHWQVEMSSPNLLVLSGLKLESLRRGDHVTVSAYPARNGSNLGYAKQVSHAAH